MPSATTIGDRVRTLRLAAGMSQAELVQAITGREEPSNKLVSQIESGRHGIGEDLIRSLARALQCTPDFLLRPPHDVIVSRPWLRAYADANAKVVECVMADNAIAHEVAHTLDLKQIPDQIPLFDEDLNDDDAIETFAGDVRAAAGIPTGAVVGNAM
ncbi:MAG TPA: helix-turn-helix transcriptional regulator, partial [Thermomicrobiaceae bacterium]|nr:helix-turn-helix transcriptional regulator [Thermomicrobiaceae bacterium]